MNDALLGEIYRQMIVVNAKAVVEEDDSLLRDVESCRRDDGQVTMLRWSLQFD